MLIRRRTKYNQWKSGYFARLDYDLKGESRLTVRQYTDMQTKITIISDNLPELVDIQCHSVTDEVRDILSFVNSRQGILTGTADSKQYEIPVSEIFYIESIDRKTFIYTQDMVYETRHKLYVLEEMLQEKLFLRVSKSMLLNLMKVSSIQPAPGARFLAVLHSGEEVLISRKYVPGLKQALKG